MAVVAAEEAAAVGTKGFGADMVLDRWDHEWTKNARAGRGTLRVPGARQPRGDARHDAPRRALPHPLAISRQAIRRRVQTRGFVRLRVATHARGGAAMVRVRGRGERSEPGRHRRETSSLGRRVRHTRRVALTVGGGARTRVVRRHVATRQRRVSPPRQRGTRTPGLVFGRRDESAADAQPSVVPVHPRAGGGCRGTPRRGRRRNVARRRFRVGVGGGVSSGVPETPQHSAFDAVEDRSCLEEGITGEGPLGSLAGLKHSFVQYEEREITGAAGLQKVGEWLDSGSFALDGAHGFPLLFELLTGTVPLRVLTGDDPRRWGCALLRFVPRSSPSSAAPSCPRCAFSRRRNTWRDAAPKVEERGMSARMAAVFTHDGAIGMLLRRVQPFLRERAAGDGRRSSVVRRRTGRRSGTNPGRG